MFKIKGITCNSELIAPNISKYTTCIVDTIHAGAFIICCVLNLPSLL